MSTEAPHLSSPAGELCKGGGPEARAGPVTLGVPETHPHGSVNTRDLIQIPLFERILTTTACMHYFYPDAN